MLAELSKGDLDPVEQRRLLRLFIEALHLWKDCYTERMERELGSLLLAHVGDSYVVRELAFVLEHRASPTSERILLEAMRRAYEQRHDASLIALLHAVVDWIGEREALLDEWVEHAIASSITNPDAESTALLAGRYLRHRPARAPWLAALLRENPAVTQAVGADINLLFLSPTADGILEWSQWIDSVQDDELSVDAPWLDFQAIEGATRLAYEGANDEQRAALVKWSRWLEHARGVAHATLIS
jgi:hypothetical protein